MKQIPLSVPYLNGNELKYLKECIDTNWVSSVGKYVDLFEEQVASYLGIEYSIATVNGTAAIHAALKVLGIGTGDKVLVPALTFIATVNPIIYCGAEPVFIDSEEETYNVDPMKTVQQIEKMVDNGEKPSAVIVVHLFGHPADIDPILKVCSKHNIYVIEDATEAIGARYKDKMIGTLGDIACFSFNGNKIITTGGGGMLLTGNSECAQKARYLTTQAKDDPIQFIHREIGYNYRLTNLQAAVGVAQLEQLDDFISKKRYIAELYTKGLQDIAGITVTREQDWAYSNFWLFSILVEEDLYGMDSKTLFRQLNDMGIMARPFFKPIHHMPVYSNYQAEITIADKLWEEGVNLPSSVNLTEEEIAYVIEKISSLAKG